MIRHKLATFFLWLAVQIEPDWVRGMFKAPEEQKKPEQTPELPPQNR
jgi:hypothetical protein